jgi:thiamine transport system permease protein
MKVSRFSSRILSYALVFYFLVPYFLFLKFFNLTTHLDFQELAWAFKNSFVQSFSAAFLVTVLSLPLSGGLFLLPARFYEFVKKLLLLPQILPSIFSILIAFSIWKPFPTGTVGIAFIFLMVHLGFAVIFMHTAIIEKLSSFPAVAEIFGIDRFLFFRRIFFPAIKADLLSCFLMVFIFCFSSFSIPLVAGGGRDTNVEVLIFEKIFINQSWSSAWTIGILQSLFLSLMSLFLLRTKSTVKAEFFHGNYLKSNIGYVGLLVYLFIYLGGYGLGVIQALPELTAILNFFSDIWGATLNTIKIFILYLSISSVLLYLWLYDFAKNYKMNYAVHLIAASTIIVGFSFYLSFPTSKEWDLFKIPIAMSILVFPVLFKSFLEKPLQDLKDQVITAQVFGISTRQIVVQVLFRRIQRPIMVWFSFLSIWFLSDFAVLRALGTQTETLGLMTQGFLSGYRLSYAYLMSVYILLVWVCILALGYLFKEVIRVAYKKLVSSF